MTLVQRISTPSDSAGRSVELALADRGGALWWSVRVDAWTEAAASAWYPLDELDTARAVLEQLAGSATALTPDVAVSTTGTDFDVHVEVTSPDGARLTATADVRHIRHAAESLVTRARDHAEFLRGRPRGG